ncbi:MAG: Tim44/TimA family putative adaptor protein [Gammaproteobacteria bacterium]|nr:Tim44/TimA family putative adaptor protein [Pelagibacterales bacterium]MBT7542484.1 Tim44/TimA family putative adaptor protein [Gammaproteobacteria bacterium]
MQYFDIILFAVIAGVLGIRLYRILGVKSKIITKKMENIPQKIVNIKQDLQETLEPIEVENGTGLGYLIKVFPKFSKKEFLSGAEKAFNMILNAKYEGNKKLLISYLEDDVFRLFEKVILEREGEGLMVEEANIEVKKTNISEIKVLENIAYIRVDFDYLESLLIKKSDGTVFSDNIDSPNDLNITWTFSRSLDSDSPNWKLFGTNKIN